jgi:hypothetical protein
MAVARPRGSFANRQGRCPASNPCCQQDSHDRVSNRRAPAEQPLVFHPPSSDSRPWIEPSRGRPSPSSVARFPRHHQRDRDLMLSTPRTDRRQPFRLQGAIPKNKPGWPRASARLWAKSCSPCRTSPAGRSAGSSGLRRRRGRAIRRCWNRSTARCVLSSTERPGGDRDRDRPVFGSAGGAPAVHPLPEFEALFDGGLRPQADLEGRPVGELLTPARRDAWPRSDGWVKSRRARAWRDHSV